MNENCLIYLSRFVVLNDGISYTKIIAYLSVSMLCDTLYFTYFPCFLKKISCIQIHSTKILTTTPCLFGPSCSEDSRRDSTFFFALIRAWGTATTQLCAYSIITSAVLFFPAIIAKFFACTSLRTRHLRLAASAFCCFGFDV